MPFLTTPAGKLHYLKQGRGSKLLIAFHGYSNNAQLWLPIARYIGTAYTVIAIDLPHHGQSRWEADKPLKKVHLIQLVKDLLHQHNATTCTLAGFSLGGRVCLTIVEQAPQLVAQLILAAPDGLAFNPWYFLLTRTGIGRSLFHRFTTSPEGFLRFVDWAHRRGWLPASRHRFVINYVQPHWGRDFLRKVWSVLCYLLPSPTRVKANIRRLKIPVHIFMGQHDTVIPPHLAMRFAKGLPTVQVNVLDKGHRLLDDECLRLIANRL